MATQSNLGGGYSTIEKAFFLTAKHVTWTGRFPQTCRGEFLFVSQAPTHVSVSVRPLVQLHQWTE